MNNKTLLCTLLFIPAFTAAMLPPPPLPLAKPAAPLTMPASKKPAAQLPLPPAKPAAATEENGRWGQVISIPPVSQRLSLYKNWLYQYVFMCHSQGLDFIGATVPVISNNIGKSDTDSWPLIAAHLFGNLFPNQQHVHMSYLATQKTRTGFNIEGPITLFKCSDPETLEIETLGTHHDLVYGSENRKNYLRTLITANCETDPGKRAKAQGELGNIYFNSKKYDDAWRWYLLASQQTVNKMAQLSGLINKALVIQEKKDPVLSVSILETLISQTDPFPKLQMKVKARIAQGLLAANRAPTTLARARLLLNEVIASPHSIPASKNRAQLLLAHIQSQEVAASANPSPLPSSVPSLTPMTSAQAHDLPNPLSDSVQALAALASSREIDVEDVTDREDAGENGDDEENQDGQPARKRIRIKLEKGQHHE